MHLTRLIAIGAGVLMILLNLPGVASSPDAGKTPTAEQLVQVHLHSLKQNIQPGEQFLLAVEFTIQEHWHIYWKNSGESGMPTEVRVAAPDGFDVGEIRYPRPRRFRDTDGITFGYEKDAILFIPITAPESLVSPSVTLTCEIDWLVCNRICMIGHVKRELTLTTGLQDSPPQTPDTTLFQARVKHLPQSLDAFAGATANLENGRLIITGPAGDYSAFDFFPVSRPGVEFGKAEITSDNRTFHIEVPVSLRPDRSLGQPLVVEGLVALGSQRDDPCYNFRIHPVDE